jgi:hypothetical protein
LSQAGFDAEAGKVLPEFLPDGHTPKLEENRALERRIYAAFFLHAFGFRSGIRPMKTALHALLLTLLFVSSGCSRSNAGRISNVLNECSEISHRAANYNGNPEVQASFIASEFQKIDVTACPADFRMAFQAHVFSWQQAASAFANNSLSTNFLEGFLGGVTGDPSLIGGASNHAAGAQRAINDTYFELTQIASRYGARIPHSVAGQNSAL